MVKWTLPPKWILRLKMDARKEQLVRRYCNSILFDDRSSIATSIQAASQRG
jgi:hypothetical protein